MSPPLDDTIILTLSLQAADATGKGYLDFSDFQRFVKTLKRRPEIEELYGKIASDNGGKFDFAAFEKFNKEVQKVRMWLSFSSTML